MSVYSVAYIAPNQLDHKRTIRSCEEISGTLCRGDRGEIPVLPVRSKAGELCDESAKPEGLFCFGSEYPELAAAVAETGICGPVITDYPAMAASCGDAVPATGILDLTPEEEIRRACEALVGLIEHPETPGIRRCFTPSLRWKDGSID